MQLDLQMWSGGRQMCLQLAAVRTELQAHCCKWKGQLHKSLFYLSKPSRPQINQRKSWFGPAQSLFICKTAGILHRHPSQWEEFKLFTGQRQCDWSVKENWRLRHGRCWAESLKKKKKRSFWPKVFLTNNLVMVKQRLFLQQSDVWRRPLKLKVSVSRWKWSIFFGRAIKRSAWKAPCKQAFSQVSWRELCRDFYAESLIWCPSELAVEPWANQPQCAGWNTGGHTQREIGTFMGGICFQLFPQIYHRLEGLCHLVQKRSWTQQHQS